MSDNSTSTLTFTDGTGRNRALVVYVNGKLAACSIQNSTGQWNWELVNREIKEQLKGETK